MSSKLVYSTESDVPNSRGPLASNLCKHGKDAGQTCNPCDVWDEMDAQWNDVDMGDAHYASFDAYSSSM